MSGGEEATGAFAGKTIAVAGAGAIGGTIGGCLSRSGSDVWLVDEWQDHVRAMQEGGLRLDDPDGSSVVMVRALHTSEIDHLPAVDILLVSVKSYDTARLVSLFVPHLQAGAFAVSCQNGLNEETIASLVGASATLGCLIDLGAALVAPGHVRRLTRYARLAVGELDGKMTPRVHELARLMSTCAETRITGDIGGDRWVKLALNCMGNPILALTGYTVGQLHGRKMATVLLRAIIFELVSVAEAAGHKIKILGIPHEIWKTDLSETVPAIVEALDRHGRALASLRSSMSYDLDHRRPLEIEYLNGYVVKKGEEVGIATPINSAIVALVKDLERGVIRPGPEHFDALVALIPPRYHPA